LEFSLTKLADKAIDKSAINKLGLAWERSLFAQAFFTCLIPTELARELITHAFSQTRKALSIRFTRRTHKRPFTIEDGIILVIRYNSTNCNTVNI